MELKKHVKWAVGEEAQQQYSRYGDHVLNSIAAEISDVSGGFPVRFSGYRAKSDSDDIRKLTWHNDISAETPEFIVDKLICKVTGLPKMIKFPAKRVCAYSVKMCKHTDYIEIFSIISSEHLVAAG